jgi:hypothetical protein
LLILGSAWPQALSSFNAEFAELAEKALLCVLSVLCVQRRSASDSGRLIVTVIGRHTSRWIIAR